MELNAARKILVCLPYGIGDVVMQLPLLDALHRRRSQRSVTGLGARPALELLEQDGRVDQLACVQDWGFHHWRDSGTREQRDLLRAWVQFQQFDAVVGISHAVLGVRWAIWEATTRIFDACSAAEETILLNGGSGIDAIKAAMWEGLGVRIPEDLLPRVRIALPEREFAADLLQRRAGPGEKWVGISPVASLSLKRWPADRLAAVADRLVTKYGYRVLLICGPQEEDARQVLSRLRFQDQVLVIGSLHLLKVAALLEKCSLFVCNDTGLMHVAAAVGTPVVALFGPTHPQLYLPPGANAALGGRGIDCGYRNTTALGPPGCWGQNRCLIGPESCINRVSVSDVLAAVLQLLHSTEMEYATTETS